MTAANPAKPGEVLVACATNLAAYSAVSNAPQIGMAASADPLPRIDNPGLWTLRVRGLRQLNSCPASPRVEEA